MGDVVAQCLRDRYTKGVQWVLKSVDDLTEDQFTWRPTSAAHSIAFNLWHVGRWDDILQAEVLAKLPDRPKDLRTDQIWHAEKLAARWNLNTSVLGSLEAGTGMDDAVAADLKLPDKTTVTDYARRVFEAVTRAVRALSDEDVRYTVAQSGRPICDYLITYLAHDDFHRGQIAALRRAQSLPRVRA